MAKEGLEKVSDSLAEEQLACLEKWAKEDERSEGLDLAAQPHTGEAPAVSPSPLEGEGVPGIIPPGPFDWATCIFIGRSIAEDGKEGLSEILAKYGKDLESVPRDPDSCPTSCERILKTAKKIEEAKGEDLEEIQKILLKGAELCSQGCEAAGGNELLKADAETVSSGLRGGVYSQEEKRHSPFVKRWDSGLLKKIRKDQAQLAQAAKELRKAPAKGIVLNPAEQKALAKGEALVLKGLEAR